ncbi:transcriptional repressor LexA [Varunaivibrio sulfuroxidans]|uniref:LexA repressor n=1 Tax=Varunaivibrio sulfuroxidans TaxID=1773489 RepID=A0A4R3JDP7_9PROT|nr:transcriptional repressor LexA [Varunaivibrio sulfuroxidans]TCS64179.1 repressor LexA [Varunaivibrio sulfuroxidans]WES31375.1 transcriptional repressor LexA [Varunaivibrio sulfuroxidans]
MLTRKQYDLLLLIDKGLKTSGVSPSYDEMKDALGLASKSGIHRLISALEERGFVRRLPHRARALEVLKLPENLEDTATRIPRAPLPTQGTAKGGTSFSPNVIRGDFQIPGARSPQARTGDAIELPLYGRIAAGIPIEAIRDPENTVHIPQSMVGSGEHYALEVDGDSMIDAGIQDGDTIIIQRADQAENGAIVVALVDDQEVTLKRFRRKGASIALEPANKRYETRIFGPNRVKVQGKLVGLIRQY